MTAYLDHAATTPMSPAAIEAMVTELRTVGNASSLHGAGRRARRVVEESREQIAASLGARPSEVVFTSGGTEADNLAVIGGFRARQGADPGRRRVLASAVEHHAVLDSVQWLVDNAGAEAVWLPVDHTGRLDLDAFAQEVERDPGAVALVTVMWANNEVGTVQPIRDVVDLAHAHGIPVHTDAVQAVGHLPVDFTASGVDLLSLTGHKLGGPPGCGALLAVRGAALLPVQHGGGQERGLRSGTLDTPAVRALAVALTEAVDGLAESVPRVRALADRLVRGVMDAVPDAVRHGGAPESLPGIVNLAFAGCDGDSLLYLLDAQGIECSTGSACQAGVPQPSHVLLAMGVSEELVRGALRLTLGTTSTAADVDAVVSALPGAVERARGAGLATRRAG